MSLDVYLRMPEQQRQREETIYVREDGRTRAISRDEWNQMYPDREPVTVLEHETDEVFSANITHNLNKMADAAGIYHHLWRPDEIGITVASELIEPLTQGLATLRGQPERFQKLNPANGWGSYEVLVEFVREYLAACIRYPTAEVSVWR